jgi:hypothetical protein
MSIEYLYEETFGVALALTQKLGKYTIA